MTQQGLDIDGLIKLATMKVEEPEKYKQVMEALNDVMTNIMEASSKMIEKLG